MTWDLRSEETEEPTQKQKAHDRTRDLDAVRRQRFPLLHSTLGSLDGIYFIVTGFNLILTLNVIEFK